MPLQVFLGGTVALIGGAGFGIAVAAEAPAAMPWWGGLCAIGAVWWMVARLRDEARQRK